MNGIINWFARNSVAANLLMVFIIVSGAISVFTVKQEVFPEFSLDRITVSIPYLGAAPDEVEQAVNVRIEEAIQGIDGIKEITSTASEGSGSVMIELELGADARKVVDEVRSNVDAIDTFPVETEKPIVRELIARRQVIDIAISGQTDEGTLKLLAEQVRDDLSAHPEITQVEIISARPYEISIEVSETALRRHGLSFDEVAQAIRRTSLDLPGGSVRTDGGEILLRTIGQAYRGNEYESLVLRTRVDGTRLQLGEVATVVDGFAETDQAARFDGEATVLVSVFRTGEQSALEIAEVAEEYVTTAAARMPAGISLTTWQDQAEVLDERLSLLLRNGATGFVLVFLVLALFLELRLAVWTSLGIPISFLGALWLMPGLDVSINVMSLFAFILVLGIVVDDAIVVGENIYTHQERHGEGLRGAIEGAQEISVPVIFAVLTSVAAFLPLMMVPGMMGKIFRVIPLIVIPCLLFSLVESLQILPAHLSHIPKKRARKGPWARFQGLFANGLKRFIREGYRPSLDLALRWRYSTAALGAAFLVLTVGMVLGGWTTFHFFPSIEASFISAAVTMPQGTPATGTADALVRLEEGIDALRGERAAADGTDPFRHVYSSIGDQPMAAQGGSPFGAILNRSSSNLGEVTVELAMSDDRSQTSEMLGNRWRELTGIVPEATEVKFTATMMSPGDDIDVQLTGGDDIQLRAAADAVKARLLEYAGVFDISDSFREGKQEMKLGIKPAAETLGLTLQDLGHQVRQAFYGEEAQRIQRGRDDVRVMVRYPEDERRSLGDLDNMRIRTPDGGEVPFNLVAVMEPGRGFASITRVDRLRAINVTAAVDAGVTSAQAVIRDLETRILPEVLSSFSGISYSFEGAQAEQRDAVGGLQQGFGLALLMIFALLAIPLRSYIQPLIIMSAIPFGLVGAVWGHILLGLDVTMMSMFGLVALTGVVVNDSLIMVDFINRKRERYGDLDVAVREAGAARFRPILLTSLTTFFGLVPLMAERSFGAQYLVPMAVSLAFGVLFATFITLILVPTAYLIVDDIKQGVLRLLGKVPVEDTPDSDEPLPSTPRHAPADAVADGPSSM
ncbi:MAG TPA: efflux RND transporter permease subunit [Vicinamibacterales bacterium]|jgi:multidrug efflux pump subunit AcrB|nr:efflux RND transporter permease subunit [Vicinamibacterales bacterium]HJN43326.1 efflux RND transporter permease subunit [Vicinamibacterales bacterium]